MEKDPRLPSNYQRLMPYLIVAHADRFISFLIEVFGARETLRVMRNETEIQHAEVMVDDCTIMIADFTPVYKIKTAAIFIYVENADLTFQKALDHGSTIVSELSDQDYGRCGGVQDPFENIWWITTLK